MLYNVKKALEGKYGPLRVSNKVPRWLFNELFNSGKRRVPDHPLYFSGREGILGINIVVSNQYSDSTEDEYWAPIPQVDERYPFSFERPFFHTESKKMFEYAKWRYPDLMNVYVGSRK